MSEFYSPNDWLPSDLSPFPNVGTPCARCGTPTHIYEQDLADLPEGIVCGACMRRQAKRQRSADGRRDLTKQHHWKHGDDPEDDKDASNPDNVYLTLEPTKAPQIVRPAFGGGPETPFLCETCGTRLRAVAERTVAQVLAPIGYRVPDGRTAPKVTVVALVCPNDKPDQRHKYMQMRSDMLALAMEQRHD